MHRYLRHFRWAWAPLVAAVGLGAVVLAPQLGFGKVAQPLWTDRSVAVAPVVAPAPNWVELVKSLKPAVVNISTKRVQEGPPFQSPLGDKDPFQQFYKQFFGDQPRRMVRSLGSGFVIHSDGYIVTNNHVVEGATEIRVKIEDGRELPAKLVGRDPKTDLALLKVEAMGLPVIPLGDSSQLQVGEQVMAIGNPFGLERTVTTGIVSATGRVIGQGPYDDFIQTDASINPGNSGGPLINARGQAVGINAAIFSQSGGSVGIGFAIPIDQAKSVLTQLADSGKVTRGWLGVSIQPVTADLAKGFKLPEAGGALVASVQDGSPASKAGVKAGDVIMAYDGKKVARSEDLPRLVAATAVGREVPITVVRDGKPTTLNVKVAQMEEPTQQVLAQSEDRSSLGLTVETLTPSVARDLRLSDTRGVVVRDVKDGSPAASAGIQPGDVIVELDHEHVGSVAEMKHLLEKHPKGAPLVVLLHRDGANLYVALAA